jgi:hypothetical protein
VPLFDLLKGQDMPYEGFGDILPYSSENNNSFDSLTEEAEERMKESFGVELNDVNKTIVDLENTIEEMWQEGWNPEEANINLFATDFGLLLSKIIKELYGGTTIFRSSSELNHLSIWWNEKGVEVFPFHKAYKCLTNEYGENMVSFVKDLKHILEEEEEHE